MTDIEKLREARDTAQTSYAHSRQRLVMGKTTAREHEKARNAYMLAQDEYRRAMIANNKRGTTK